MAEQRKGIPDPFGLVSMARLFNRDFPKKCIPLFASLLLITSCRQWGIEPEVQFGLTVIVAVVSFVIIFTKPILGIYAVSVIAISFSPPIRVGFANLYFHQWIILLALLASVSSGLVLGNIHTKLKSGINLPMLIFISSLLLSLSHTPNMIVGIKSFLYIAVLIASYYLVLLCIGQESHIRIFVGLLIVMTTVTCLISLKYYGAGRLGSVGILGSFGMGNPNTFANLLALVIPFCLALFLHGELDRRKKLPLGLCLILMFISLGLTFSRSAWVGVFISIASLFVFKPKKILLLILCGIIGAVFLFYPLHKRVFEDISDPGAQYRIAKAKIAYSKFKERPILGNGLGSFHYEAQFSNIWAYRAHSTLENNYLLMLVEGGIIEFLAFVYLMTMLAKRAIPLLRRIQAPFLYSVLLGAIVGIISTLMAGMFENTLFFPKINWLIGLFMGIVTIVEVIYEDSTSSSDDGSNIEIG